MNKVVDNEYDCGCQTGRDVDSGAAFVRHCTEHFDEVREKVEDVIERMLEYDADYDSLVLATKNAAQAVLLMLE